ncbi:MAG: hypothetical protein JO194_09335 [Candidatus Eremiobacteraeota bacterium]|nr:hypothetical protein [Candidatus Eremiobacteraeota bacterium]
MSRVPMKLALSACLIAVAACAGGCGTHARSAALASPSPLATASAHIDIHGVVSFVHDAGVKRCYVGKPGSTLLNGYSVTFAGDARLDGGEVLVPSYTTDGRYDRAAVIVNVAPGPGFKYGTTLEERPQTFIEVTIKDSGRSGVARFMDFRSIYGRNGDARGGRVDGSISWTCAQIVRDSAAQ